jgi:hypothetical protein
MSNDSIGIHLSVNVMWEADDDYEYIDRLRTEHYPPELLFNPAHIGLFTRLTVPPHLRGRIIHDIRQVATGRGSFNVKFAPKPERWGKAVVLRINSSVLKQIWRDLSNRFLPCSLVI